MLRNVEVREGRDGLHGWRKVRGRDKPVSHQDVTRDSTAANWAEAGRGGGGYSELRNLRKPEICLA